MWIESNRTVEMTYIPPSVSAPCIVQEGVNPFVTKKKKTRKALVPGFGGRCDVSDDAQSQSAVSHNEGVSVDIVDHESAILEAAREIIAVGEELEDHDEETESLQDSDDEQEDQMADPIPNTDEHRMQEKDEICEWMEKKLDLAKRERALRKERLIMNEKIQELESQQNELCSAEQFEAADKLEEEISNLRESLFALNNEYWVEIPRLFQETNSKISELNQLLLEDKSNRLRSMLQHKQMEEKRLESAKETLIKDIDRIRSIDLIFADRAQELDAEEKVLKARSEKVEEEIALESRQIAAEMEEKKQEYSRLDSLILELQEALSLAVAQRSECSVMISGNELKLKNIRMRYTAEIEELDLGRKEFQEKKKAFFEEKTGEGGGDLELVEKELGEVVAELESIKNNDEIAILETEILQLSKFVRDTEAWESQLTQLKAPLKPLITAYIEASECTNFLTDSYRDSETQLDSFRRRLDSLKEKVPLLEAEKKIAIQDRAFREAKELTNELKSTLDEIQGAETRLHELKQSVKQNRSELSRAIYQEKKEKAQLAQAELSHLEKCTTCWNDRSKAVLAPLANSNVSDEVRSRMRLQVSICEVLSSDLTQPSSYS